MHLFNYSQPCKHVPHNRLSVWVSSFQVSTRFFVHKMEFLNGESQALLSSVRYIIIIMPLIFLMYHYIRSCGSHSFTNASIWTNPIAIVMLWMWNCDYSIENIVMVIVFSLSLCCYISFLSSMLLSRPM